MSKRGPRPSLGARLARFVVYGCLTGAVIARNSPAIRDSARALLAQSVYLPAIPCIPCALTLGGLLLAYLTWLSGATFGDWSMPLALHLVPGAMLALTLVLGPLAPMAIPAGVDTTRSPDLVVHQAMLGLGQAVEEGRVRCADPSSLQRVVEDPSRFPLPGYRHHGFLARYRVRVGSGEAGPIESADPGDAPPSLLVACTSRSYWITAVTMDLTSNRPAILLDGVGRVAQATGNLPGATP